MATKLTKEQKTLIFEAWDYCDEKDKSTEFMLQYMSDAAAVDYDVVVDYFTSKEGERDRASYIAQQNRKNYQATKSKNK